jgi:CIC family chloride channel protein
MLAGGGSMIVVGGVFLVRFGLGPVSYAAGTPGGLFAPMLVLGAQSGLVLGTLFCRWFPYLAERPAAFAVLGMASAAFWAEDVADNRPGAAHFQRAGFILLQRNE